MRQHNGCTEPGHPKAACGPHCGGIVSNGVIEEHCVPDDLATSDRPRWWAELKRLAAVLSLALLAYFVGYQWYEISHTLGESARIARLPEIERQFHCFNLVNESAWFGIVSGAALVYGAIGWRYLGGWLVAPHLVTLLALCGAMLGASIDARRHPDPSIEPELVYAVQGGAVAGLIVSLGLAWLHRADPRRPVTLRTVFSAVLVMAVLLGGARAWMQWCEAEQARRLDLHARSLRKEFSKETEDDRP